MMSLVEIAKKVEEKTQSQREGEKPLLFIDIDVGDSKKDRITVYKDNSPAELSSLFC
jgi:hypothetical protein